MKTQHIPTKRAVIYARTSGDKQKDNTSIPRQIEEGKKFISANGWQFKKSYVDESRSGSKIEGRDSFKRMMKDAANGLFDFIIIYDISRFARDGGDIIKESYFLKNNFGIHVIDTKGFDTRKPKNALLNFVFAGVAEDERLRIMERTIRGRISNAENGLKWNAKPPFGREFIKAGKHNGTWSITEDGKKMEKILQAYVDEDKSFRELAREYGLKSGQKMTYLVRESQLAAKPYIATFNSKDIGIVDYKVEVPAVPPVISKELEKRVLAKMARNQKTKRRAKRNYLLSGMVRCAHCGKYLKGQTDKSGLARYTHNNFYADKKPCPYMSIQLKILESHVMDCLTNFFFDEPAFEQAVKNALPTIDDRTAIVKDIAANKKVQAKNSSKISNLTKAIGEGRELSSLLDALQSAEAEKQALERRAVELQETLDTMPDLKIIKAQARIIRAKLMISKLTENWQNRSYQDLRRYLHFLFSDNPRQNNYGVTVGKKGDKWHIEFEGCLDFRYNITTDDAINTEVHNMHIRRNDTIRANFEKDMQILGTEAAYKGNPLSISKDYL